MIKTFDSGSASCHVFTYREGMLSAVGHDLKIKVARFTVEVDAEALRVDGRFDATSLVVVNAVDGTAERPGALSDSDKEKIRGEIHKDVLAADKHPEIRFVSTRIERSGEGYQVTGDLSLHGATKSITFTSKKQGDRQVAEITLHQPDFGIKPYRAFLGALKVRPDVIIHTELPS